MLSFFLNIDFKLIVLYFFKIYLDKIPFKINSVEYRILNVIHLLVIGDNMKMIVICIYQYLPEISRKKI